MQEIRGTLVLMGSGELTSTMVEVHKALLRSQGPAARAVFLDTPAGFQLNVDQISAKAQQYFAERVGHGLEIASLTAADVPAVEAERAYRLLREADYALVGPGSPTYAVRQWRDTPVPEIFVQRVCEGACVVAASAAALTVGRHTLPVYEIYKVGEPLHWAPGMDLLGALGIDLVVIPHWNNAEGGTHDTQRCYMGEARFAELSALLDPGVGILGLDEHTACLLDFATGTGTVRGLGSVVLRRAGREQVFPKDSRFPLSALGTSAGDVLPELAETAAAETSPGPEPAAGGGGLWPRLHAARRRFEEGLTAGEAAAATSAVLEVDRILWQAHTGLESPEDVAQMHEVLRDLIVLLGTELDGRPATAEACVAPLAEAALALRERFREERQWAAADAVRDALTAGGLRVEDTPKGPRWHFTDSG